MTNEINLQAKFTNSEHIGNFITVGKHKIHYLDKGEGEALLLVHTVGQSLYTWYRVYDALAEKYHVYAIDLPGQGYSTAAQEDELSVDSIADVLAEFLMEVGALYANVCAFSMGAIYALRMAQKYPGRVNRMVLVSPGGLTAQMPLFVRVLRIPVLRAIAAAMLNRNTIHTILSRCFFDQTALTDDTVKGYYTPLKAKEQRAAMVDMIAAFDETQTMESLRETTHRILIVWGVDDRFHELEMAETFQSILKKAEFALVRNCGHIVQEEKPQRLIEHIIDFIENSLAAQG